MNEYCLYKGTLVNGAPYQQSYGGSPHYVINLKAGDDAIFKLVVNAASDEVGGDGNNDVYFYADYAFSDPVTSQLTAVSAGLHVDDGFPRLDYWQDRSLLDIHRMRPIPYKDENGDRADVNDDISRALGIDTSAAPVELDYDDGHGHVAKRAFYPPKDPNVVVYGFGFLFLPAKDGLHETHMNQGNPKGRHWKENGAFQDGAVIIETGTIYSALFTAFQTQRLPTNAQGFPLETATALPDFIRS
jgi:uncharacterized protein YukJ